MELTEMEKRMLYQTEGTERYAVLREMSMVSRYAGDPARLKSAQSLMVKPRPREYVKFMEIGHDIRKNYPLPHAGRSIGELLAQARQRSGAEQLKGHDIMALERFDPEVRHMVIFDVLSGDSPVGDKGDRMRLFLTDAGYGKFKDRQKKGEIKIQNHAKVAPGGYLHYDRRDRAL